MKQKPWLYSRSDIQGTEQGKFAVSVSNQETDFDTQNSQHVYPGHRVALSVRIVRKEAQPGLRQAKTIQERKCRFWDELPPTEYPMLERYFVGEGNPHQIFILAIKVHPCRLPL